MSKLRYLFPLLLALLVVRISWAEGDLLDADQAFQMAAAANGTDTIRVRWTIADGYYLYRSKFKFKSDTVGISLGEPRFPKGTIKKDEFLGNVEIYRGSVEVEIPVTRSTNKATNLTITATSQGCADAGVCYPPHKQIREVILPELKPLVQPAPGFGASDQLPAFGNDQQEGVLEPDQAFQVSVGAIDSKSVTIHYEVTPHYYLYRGKLKFELDTAEGVTLGTPEIPPGEEKEDEFFGTIRVFHNSFDVRLPLLRSADAPATSVAIQLGYQGCAEAGICYPPMKKRIVADLPPASATTSNTAAAAPATVPVATNKAPISEQDRLARFLTEKPLWLSIGLFLLIGIGLTFTPCVFPMIPILSSIIVGQGKEITVRKAFILSLVYVEAMALTYALAAVAVALLGANLQAAFQNPWILSSFALVFVLLALSMFGFYELQMPAAIQTKLSEISNRQGGGNLLGVGIMGVLSALIVGPCVTAPLMAALIVIGQAGDPVLGFSTIFAMGNGMGIPLLIIGTSAGKLLPRAGVWMDVVKAIFGVLILSVAIWMLGRILPLSITQLLWAMLFIISSIYMGAIEPVGAGSSGWRKFWKGLGIVILIWGVMLLISVANLLRDDLDLRLGEQAVTAPTGHLTFKRVASEAELDAAIAAATAQGKPVMLDYYADWCVSCKEFEKYTFGNPEVQAVLAGAVLLQADVTDNNDNDKALLKRYNLIGPPAILFFDRHGQERKQFRLIGFVPAGEFSQHARQALAP